MGLSSKDKQQLQKQYFQEIRLDNTNAWQLCYICRKPRKAFVPVEYIPMPVCKEHTL